MANQIAQLPPLSKGKPQTKQVDLDGFRHNTHQLADCTLSCKYDDLIAVSNGSMSMPVAVLRRKIVVKGNKEVISMRATP